MIKLNLKEVLKKRGLTQAELAKITGIRPSTISDMCNNNSLFLGLENLDKICSVLKIDIQELIVFTPPSERNGNESS